MFLSAGEMIAMADGGYVTVEAFIASGGQGEVYAVRREGDGRRMALKWYTDPKISSNAAFFEALGANCRRQAPSAAFIWPEGITVRSRGSFGYVMRLRPEGYIVFGDYFCIDRNPEAWFRSWEAKLNAAINICMAFSSLHRAGLSYQDLNDGNFLINPHNGDVLICDNDNVVADGSNNGIIGKPRYMAPEVSEGAIPTSASDRFSLAVILYRIFMVDHPFEGRLTCGPRHACLTPAEQNRLFGRDAVFCFDTTDCRNRPVPALHPNSLLFWPMLPVRLREAFESALSAKAIAEPGARTTASAWLDIFLELQHLKIIE